MTKQKDHLYTQFEIDWLESKLASLKTFIDNNPIEDIDDRIETVTSSKGQPVVKIIATKEAALKGWILALKEFASLLKAVEEARETKAEVEAQVRKGSNINGMMSSKLEETT